MMTRYLSVYRVVSYHHELSKGVLCPLANLRNNDFSVSARVDFE